MPRLASALRWSCTKVHYSLAVLEAKRDIAPRMHPATVSLRSVTKKDANKLVEYGDRFYKIR